MTRMGLYATKCLPLTYLKAGAIELVDDYDAQDGLCLTDGCSMIDSSIVREKLGDQAVSMLARIGGAKCMLVILGREQRAKIVKRDQEKKNKRYMKERDDLVEQIQELAEKINNSPRKNKNININRDGLNYNDFYSVDKYVNQLESLKNDLKDKERQIQANSIRNDNAKIILTESSHKFDKNTYNVEIAIKDVTESVQAKVNKEFLGNAWYHYKIQNKDDKFFNSLTIYAKYWMGILERATRQVVAPTDDILGGICAMTGVSREFAIDFAETGLNTNKFKNLQNILESNRTYVTKPIIFRRGRKIIRGKRGDPGSKKFNVPYLTKIKNETDKVCRMVKDCFGAMLKKLQVGLPYPSTRIRGASDWYGVLGENEIFYKIGIPSSIDSLLLNVNQSKDENKWKRIPILCNGGSKSTRVNFNGNGKGKVLNCGVPIQKHTPTCSHCGEARPEFLVFEGTVGILKNPCLHPRGYREFKAVYNKILDHHFGGECLFFSSNTNKCQTSAIFECSGADLDGDDFLVVTQEDLLPMKGNMIDEIIPVLAYDSQGKRKSDTFIDDLMCVKYYSEYQLKENTSTLADYHEAFTEHFPDGVASPICLSLSHLIVCSVLRLDQCLCCFVFFVCRIALSHSQSVDFAKTGVAAQIPKGLPNISEIRKRGLRVYPHYMHRNPKQSYHSKGIKGRFFDFLYDNLPQQYKNSYHFFTHHGIKKLSFCVFVAAFV